MAYLAFITVVWAFSFNLIGEFLAGRVDSDFAVLSRVVLAGLVFLPFLRARGFANARILGTAVAGALQFGLTYLLLYRSFAYLTVPEVLLFTIFTPIYITLLDDAFKGRFTPRASLAALIAIAGSAIIRYDELSGHFLAGFLLLQVANLSFALGQIGYKWLVARYPSEQPARAGFGWFFVGAFLVALPSFLIFGNPDRLPSTATQWAVLVYMGLVSSALGFFWWNKGASLVDAGTLGAMNNMHIPVGIALNMLIWRSDENVLRLAAGGAVIALALWLNESWRRRDMPARP
ncbi:carboxylate/amino acid/amine transporter [Chitiniphilus eburneus]|uniref:DMT family transporter n=1 Tax=Chitiniphilus eburneus TaxID=2571148 RepID=A0A4U0QHT0_9NEIS|nr:carboxylate/amino acid/amine transporter [Chitiniphilus eburneus]TJZ75494.1 DMT family transporter [Chitiniphilus eburneus]